MLHLDPKSIVWDRFDGLEAVDPDWQNDKPYWEEFTEAFFASNGMAYDPATDSNVDAWVSAEDRAPFVDMVAALLPSLKERVDLSRIDMVLLAHWLPDLHLGSSVTNFAMHELGLDGATGFAISDRGVSAPLFALDCVDRAMEGDVREVLLLVMDQKHLLYTSPVIDSLKPENAGTAMVLTREARPGGLGFAGYTRIVETPTDWPAEVAALRHRFGLSEAATVIAPPQIAARLGQIPVREADPRLVCSAPFAALADLPARDALLIAEDPDGSISAVGFRVDPGAA